MEVKGVAFLARRQLMMQTVGEEAWRSFLEEYARREPLFAQPVMPVTRLPVDAFLRFNEALVQRFYNGDTKAWWQFGVKSAEYALGQGQLKTMFSPLDFRRFLLFTPGIWKGYFTEGELQVRPDANFTDLRIFNVPRPHLYFELSVMGFAHGGLTFLGSKSLQHEVIKGYSKGHNEVVYRFFVS